MSDISELPSGMSPDARDSWPSQELIDSWLGQFDFDLHGPSVPVAAYTGQLEPAERHRLEDALRGNELKALVATSALGMGYDKPDLAFVVHYQSPGSPIAYYQQVGRAGRAVERADVLVAGSSSFAGGENVSLTLDVLEGYDPLTNIWHAIKNPGASPFHADMASAGGGYITGSTVLVDGGGDAWGQGMPPPEIEAPGS